MKRLPSRKIRMMNNVNWKLNSNNENEIIQADHDDSGVKNIEAYV